MSFGKLYTYPKAPRSTVVLFVAKYNSLDIEICNAFPIKVYPEKGGVGEEYLSKFHTGKVPALETSSGFAVYESIAVAWFCTFDAHLLVIRPFVLHFVGYTN